VPPQCSSQSGNTEPRPLASTTRSAGSSKALAPPRLRTSRPLTWPRRSSRKDRTSWPATNRTPGVCSTRRRTTHSIRMRLADARRHPRPAQLHGRPHGGLGEARGLDVTERRRTRHGRRESCRGRVGRQADDRQRHERGGEPNRQGARGSSYPGVHALLLLRRPKRTSPSELVPRRTAPVSPRDYRTWVPGSVVLPATERRLRAPPHGGTVPRPSRISAARSPAGSSRRDRRGGSRERPMGGPASA